MEEVRSSILLSSTENPRSDPRKSDLGFRRFRAGSTPVAVRAEISAAGTRPCSDVVPYTWADDVVRLCDALDIEHPIVFGNSFGGFVAQRYLGRHPNHPAKVILSSTQARHVRSAVLSSDAVW